MTKDSGETAPVSDDEILERAEQVADDPVEADQFYEEVDRRAALLVEKEARRRSGRYHPPRAASA